VSEERGVSRLPILHARRQQAEHERVRFWTVSRLREIYRIADLREPSRPTPCLRWSQHLRFAKFPHQNGTEEFRWLHRDAHHALASRRNQPLRSGRITARNNRDPRTVAR